MTHKERLDNRIKEILDSSSLEERMASIIRVCDVDKWKEGEYHGTAKEVAHILAKEVKRWMDSDTAPLFKEDNP